VSIKSDLQSVAQMFQRIFLFPDRNFKTLSTSVVKSVIFKEFLIDVSQLDALEELEKEEDQDQGTTKTIIKVSTR
jgi:hypothetical protein